MKNAYKASRNLAVLPAIVAFAPTLRMSLETRIPRILRKPTIADQPTPMSLHALTNGSQLALVITEGLP